MNTSDSKPSSYVVQLERAQGEKLAKLLREQDFEILKPQYTQFQAKKKNISVTLYESGKLVVQGKESPHFIEFYLEPEILGTFQYGYQSLDIDLTPRIGVDEAGKGDFFGPLCIAGVFAGEKEIKELLSFGVKDSKNLNDGQIHKIAQQIRKAIPYHIVRISPLKYNEIYPKFGNLNLLLAWGHATVIEKLAEQTGCHKALIDQFSKAPLVEMALKRKKLTIDFTKRTKAEQDPVVAAASILARDAFVSGIAALGESLGIQLPKGASKQVLALGMKLFNRDGAAVFDKIAKKHFKTLDEIVSKSRKSDL